MRRIDLTLERHRDLLRRGTVLVDERDPGTQPARALLSSSTRSRTRASPRAGERRVVSKRHALRRDRCRRAQRATCTTRPISTTARSAEGEPDVEAHPRAARVRLDRPRPGAEGAGATRSRRSCPSTSRRCATASSSWIDKTEAAVKDRLTKEITYWDHRAEQLKIQEQAGKANARLNSRRGPQARRRAAGAAAEAPGGARARSARSAPLPPVVLGGLLVVPAGADRTR